MSRNISKSRSNLSTFLAEDYLDNNISITLLELALKICNSQVYQHYDIAIFYPKSRKVQYGKGQRSGEDRKSEKGREDGEGERSKESYHRNKIYLIVKKSSYFKVNVYYHIIYKC